MSIARPPDLRNAVDGVLKAFGPFRGMIDVTAEWANRLREVSEKLKKLANRLESSLDTLEAFSSHGRVGAPDISASSGVAAVSIDAHRAALLRRKATADVNAGLTNQQRQQILKGDAEKNGACFVLEGTSLTVDGTLVPLTPTLADLAQAALIDEDEGGGDDRNPFVRMKTVDEIRGHLKQKWEARCVGRKPKEFNAHCVNALFSRLRQVFRKYGINEYLLERTGDHIRLVHRRTEKQAIEQGAFQRRAVRGMTFPA